MHELQSCKQHTFFLRRGTRRSVTESARGRAAASAICPVRESAVGCAAVSGSTQAQLAVCEPPCMRTCNGNPRCNDSSTAATTTTSAAAAAGHGVLHSSCWLGGWGKQHGGAAAAAATCCRRTCHSLCVDARSARAAGDCPLTCSQTARAGVQNGVRTLCAPLCCPVPATVVLQRCKLHSILYQKHKNYLKSGQVMPPAGT